MSSSLFSTLWVVKKLSDLEMTELRRTKDSTVHGELQGWPEFGGLGSLATPSNVGIIPRQKLLQQSFRDCIYGEFVIRQGQALARSR